MKEEGLMQAYDDSSGYWQAYTGRRAWRPSPSDRPHHTTSGQGKDEAAEPKDSVFITTITPGKAQAMLANMDNPRGLSRRIVKRYAADMAAGKWYVSNDALAFDAQGRLRNGQHRLHACIMSGTPFEAVVHHGMSEGAIKNLDQGMRRNFYQILSARGMPNSKSVAAVIRLCWRWERGLLRHSSGEAPTLEQCDAWLAENPGVGAAVEMARSWSTSRFAVSAMGAFAYRLLVIDPGQASVFGDGIRTGAELPAGSPILTLRNRMASGTANQDRPLQLAIMIKGWNAWVLGEAPTKLIWFRGGAQAQRFPQLLGLEGNPYPFPETTQE
jgi:hypothetical protein